MTPTRYKVLDKKTGTLLGEVERYRRPYTSGPPGSRVWWRVVDEPQHNADTRSPLAWFLANRAGVKAPKMVAA